MPTDYDMQFLLFINHYFVFCEDIEHSNTVVFQLDMRSFCVHM